MAALRSRCGYDIFALWFLSFYLSCFPCLISAAADWMSTVLRPWCGPSANLERMSEMCCTRLAGNARPKKSPSGHHRTTLPSISSQLWHMSTIGKNLLNSNISPTCPHNMVNFGPLAAEIRWRVWDTPTNFNGSRILAALLHGTLVVGVSQTLRRWTEGATYIRQGGHHVGHWPTFLVYYILCAVEAFERSWRIKEQEGRAVAGNHHTMRVTCTESFDCTYIIIGNAVNMWKLPQNTLELRYMPDYSSSGVLPLHDA